MPPIGKIIQPSMVKLIGLSPQLTKISPTEILCLRFGLINIIPSISTISSKFCKIIPTSISSRIQSIMMKLTSKSSSLLLSKPQIDSTAPYSIVSSFRSITRKCLTILCQFTPGNLSFTPSTKLQVGLRKASSIFPKSPVFASLPIGAQH